MNLELGFSCQKTLDCGLMFLASRATSCQRFGVTFEFLKGQETLVHVWKYQTWPTWITSAGDRDSVTRFSPLDLLYMFYGNIYCVKTKSRCHSTTPSLNLLLINGIPTLFSHRFYSKLGHRSIAQTVWSRTWGPCPDAIWRFLSGLYTDTLKICEFVQVGG